MVRKLFRIKKSGKTLDFFILFFYFIIISLYSVFYSVYVDRNNKSLTDSLNLLRYKLDTCLFKFYYYYGYSNYLSSKLGLNEDNVLYFTDKFNIKYPEVFLSQIMVESGNFKSHLCLKANNLVGMKFPFSRPTVADTVYKGYSSYSSYIYSIYDYYLWQNYVWRNSVHYSKDSSLSSYIDFLSIYSQDSLYLNKIKRILQTKIKYF